MQSHPRKLVLFTAALIAGAVPSAASAAFMKVYFGPGPDGRGGYRGGYALVTDAGLAVGTPYKVNDGFSGDETRVVRWGWNVPAVELQNIATDSRGYTDTSARAINNAGIVVGRQGSSALRWDASGTAVTVLGSLGNGSGVTTMDASANAINSVGTSVGHVTNNGVLGDWRPVQWVASGAAPTELGNLGLNTDGKAWGVASAINDTGTAVGSSVKFVSGVGMGQRAVRWSAPGTAVTELATLGTDPTGWGFATATVLNAAGTAFGSAQKYIGGVDKGGRAVRWNASGTAVMELPALGADRSGYNRASGVNAANDAGTSVGSSYKYVGSVDKGTRAVRWDPAGNISELGNLGTDNLGYAFNSATDVNADGVAVGEATTYDAAGNEIGKRAVYWGADGTALNLNTLIDPAGGLLLSAASLSDTGWIGGLGQDRMFMLLLPQAGTYGRGDGNFDALLDGGDLQFLAAHYGASNPDMAADLADFDLNGVTNFEDMLTLARHYSGGTEGLSGISPAFAADWQRAQAMVPEPTSLAAIAAVTLLGVCRLRRR